MKLNIEEITKCTDCSYCCDTMSPARTGTGVSRKVCTFDERHRKIPIQGTFGIINWCELPRIDGTNKKMLMREITKCAHCTYCTLIDDTGLYVCGHKGYYPRELYDIREIDSACPLESITPSPEK